MENRITIIKPRKGREIIDVDEGISIKFLQKIELLLRDPTDFVRAHEAEK